MDATLLALLEYDNPWITGGSLESWYGRHLPADWIARRVEGAATARWGASDRAHLLIGPRQAGKSSLIWRHLADAGRPALFVDCEQALVQQWCRSAPLFLADLEDLVAPGTPLLFEEVQHLEDAGLFLKGLVDRRVGAPILATGSSSYHLLAGTRESLAGRASRTRLLPLSGAEVCATLPGAPRLVRERQAARLLERHIAIGGYPAVWRAERPAQPLAELVEAFILRDASDLHRIARPDAFRRLIHLVAGQTGSLVNHAEWASLLGVSRDTVAAYLQILVDAHVLAELRPFAGGRRSELTSRPKVFFLDPGLRNQLAGSLAELDARQDRGAALESWVLSELAKAADPQTTLHFWRSTSGAEVDFVLARGNALRAVEVKAAALKRPKLPRATRSFIEAYAPTEVLLVNTALTHEDRLGETTLRWLTPLGLVEHLARGDA